jgi:hypothetical protein
VRIAMGGAALAAFGGARARLRAVGFHLVCVRGGPGPPHDDLTMEAVARVTGRPMRLDEAALEMVRAQSLRVYRRPDVGRAVQEKQATLPEGARVLPPPGTAPGCALVHEGTVIVVLPGPPWELARMWEEAIPEEPLERPADRVEAVPHHLDPLDRDAAGAERAGEDARVALLDGAAQDLVAGDQDRRARRAGRLSRRSGPPSG